MFLRRIFKGIPDVGPWLGIAELLAAVATVYGVLIGLNVMDNPFAKAVPTGTISATVTDIATGRPVPEATVQILDNTSQVLVYDGLAPDAEGCVAQVVKPGSYTVRAVCDGYCPTGKSVSVAEKSCRIVRLPIRQGGAIAASAQPMPQPQGGYVAAPSGGHSSSPPPAAPSASAASRPPTPPAASNQSGVQAQLDTAKQLYLQGRYQDAKDACAAALKHDPADGKVYAKLVLLNLDPACENIADAKDWAREGQQKAKKNKDELKKAILEMPSN